MFSFLAFPLSSGKNRPIPMSPVLNARWPRRMGWAAVVVLGAGSIGVLAWARDEPVSALWMVIAAACVFAARLPVSFGLVDGQGSDLGRTARASLDGSRRRQGFCPHPQMGRVRPPFRRHRGPRPAHRSGAGRPVRLPARPPLDADRRHLGRRGPRQHNSFQLGPPRRQIARANGQGRGRPLRRACRPGRNHRDTGHPPRRPRTGRGQGADQQSLGPVHHRGDDADRTDHGTRHALGRPKIPAPDRNQRFWRARLAGRRLGRQMGARFELGGMVHAHRPAARLVPDDLRPVGLDPPGLAPARAARLPEHLHENRNGRGAGGGDHSLVPDAEDAGADAVHRWQRPRVRRPGLPLLFHHHRLRGDFGLPLGHRVRHDAEADLPRNGHSRGGLRRDDHRNVRRRHGPDRGLHDAAGRVLRDQCGRRGPRRRRPCHRPRLSLSRRPRWPILRPASAKKP